MKSDQMVLFSGEASFRIPEATERRAPIKAAEKTAPAPPPPPPLPKTPTVKPAVAPAPSMKKAPTEKPPAAATSSIKKPLNNAASRKQDIAAPKPPLPPPPPPQRAQTTRGRPIGEIEVDAWEKAEMAKIKEK